MARRWEIYGEQGTKASDAVNEVSLINNPYSLWSSRSLIYHTWIPQNRHNE